MSSAPSRPVSAVVVVLLLAGAAALGFATGAWSDDDEGTITCRPGPVLSIESSGADGTGNGTRTLTIGDCERIDEAAFLAAVEALTPAPTTTTTTTEPATTTTAAPTTTTTAPE